MNYASRVQTVQSPKTAAGSVSEDFVNVWHKQADKILLSFIEQKLNQIKKFDQSVFNCPALKLLVTKTAPTYFYNRKVGFIFRGSIRVSLCKNYFAKSPSNFAFERSMLLIELNHQTCLEFFVLCRLSFPPWRV